MKVLAVRFTADVPAQRRFLAALGLAPRVGSDGGGWVDLAGDGGLVGLHAAATADAPRTVGETALSFEADEPLEAVLDRLHAAGFADAHVVDEAFGRSLRVTDPEGVEIQVNEAMGDLYGYHREDAGTAGTTP